MKISVVPIAPSFAAEITGYDLAEPLGDRVRDLVVETMDRYAVCVIRGKPVSQEQQIAFARKFGPLDSLNGVLQTDIKRRVKPELVDISNMDESNNILDGIDALN